VLLSLQNWWFESESFRRCCRYKIGGLKVKVESCARCWLRKVEAVNDSAVEKGAR
jgi:hypothetical protein